MNKPELLPTGEYHATVRQQYVDKIADGYDKEEIEILKVVWTIDEDTDFRFRNLVEERDLNDTIDIGTRSRLFVGIKQSGRFRKNFIIEHCPPTQAPHFDVTKERNDDHFYHSKNKRKLPCVK